MGTEPLILKGKRQRLVKALAEKGIRSEKVLSAIGKVQRHRFVLEGMEQRSYEDIALQIDEHQTISQPFMVAYQTELLDVKPGDKVLEIGTGSGYQGSVLCEMGAEVYSVERIEKLHKKSKHLFRELGYKNINLKYGDGFAGWAEKGPFDKIVVTAAAPKFPEQLGKQMKIGGIMVIPIGEVDKVQKLHIYTKVEENKFMARESYKVRFVPMLPGFTERYEKN